jgi:hypothetical protein
MIKGNLDLINKKLNLPPTIGRLWHPPFSVLDPILQACVEEDKEVEDIAKMESID